MNMKVRAHRRLRRLLVGIAVIVGWLPAYTAGIDDIRARYNFPAAPAPAVSIALPITPVRGEGKGRTKVKCAECGLIVSMREITGNDGGFHRTAASVITVGNQVQAPVKVPRRYEITIRMADGSSRVIGHDNPASWRPGERVIVIAGASRPPARKVQSWAQ